MPHWLRRTVHCLAVIATGMFCASPLAAQVRDSLRIITTPNGPYSTCLSITVTNRHDSTARISEFRLRLISGHGEFISGSSSSPESWTLFQNASTAAWLSGAQAADITSGRSLGGFSLCIRDTGIIRIVWETRTLAGVLSSDTLRLAGGNGQCDEAFFRPQPSRAGCVFDIDLRAGVIGGRPVTDFNLRSLTPGATFSAASVPLPAGWTRTQARPDLITFHRPQGGLGFGEFVEGFRVLFAALPDSARVAWWTLSEGDLNCADTVTLRCQSVTVDDTVRFAASDTLGSCCHDVTLVNAHRPGSTIDAFVIQVLTPGITIVADTVAPASWTRRQLNAAGDSLAFGGMLASGDSTIFRSVCFDNGNIGDTVRYRWSTYAAGVLVDSGTGATRCIRPLLRCDSASIAVTGPATETNQCLTMGVTNQNSRSWPINRIVVTIDNDGTRRRVRSAQAALQGWRVDRFTADSIIYSGGTIPPGGSISPGAFTFCVSLGDSTTAEPLRVTWHTFSALGDLCAATVPVQMSDTSVCDSVDFSGSSFASNDSRCCFDIRFTNRNGRRRQLDSFVLTVATPGAVLTNGGQLPIGWGVGWSGSGQTMKYISVAGLDPGMSTPQFTGCIDMRSLDTPLEIPIVWSTYSDGELICSGTLMYTCAPPPVLCDSVQMFSATPGDVSCLYSYRLVNSHTPGGDLNTVRFEIVDGDGEIMNGTATGGASTWSVLSQSGTSVIFRGPTLLPGAAIDAFNIVIRPTGGRPIVVEACTFSNATQICCSRDTLICGTSGVELAGPSGFRLYESQPNPFSGVTTIRYELLRSSSVALRVTDGEGREVRRIERGGQSAGEHAIRLDLSDLPSGVYYYTLQAGTELDTRRMVLVK